MLQLNTNVTALNALYNLNQVSDAVASSIQKLSSGLRINSAADDPAGLIISENLRAQVTGLNQAIANGQDATNLIKTADGALSEVSNLLNNIRQLAVHAANTGVNDITAVEADQTQINSAVQSIERIAEQTQFGDKHLLDGTAGVSASVTNTAVLSGINIGGVFDNLSTVGGPVTIQVTQQAARAVFTGTTTFANGANSTIGLATGGKDDTVVINGQTFTFSASMTVQQAINQINAASNLTGVNANFDTSTNQIVLTQTTYGHNYSISEQDSLGATGVFGTSAAVQGTDAVVAVTAQVLQNNVTTAVTVNFNGGMASTDSGLLVKDIYGNSMLLTENGNASATTPTVVAQVSANMLQFQVGGNAGQLVQASLGNIRVVNLGNTVVAGYNLSNIDVTTGQGAENAIRIVDEAISQVSQLRANLGALQSQTLQATANYLGIGVQNLSASESQIRDTNVAQEVVNLTKNQIIEQSATAMLAQANAAPQLLLKLLG